MLESTSLPELWTSIKGTNIQVFTCYCRLVCDRAYGRQRYTDLLPAIIVIENEVTVRSHRPRDRRRLWLHVRFKGRISEPCMLHTQLGRALLTCLNKEPVGRLRLCMSSTTAELLLQMELQHIPMSQQPCPIIILRCCRSIPYRLASEDRSEYISLTRLPNFPDEGWTVSFLCILVHSSIPGNERFDSLAAAVHS